jgi:aminoglycoside phosphotransferase (APT) family kinase protein
MCRRAFGAGGQIETVRELGGGTFNTTYLVTFQDGSKSVLRVAPPATADTSWDEAALMRREYLIQPFFAAIAALMPKIMMIDFTHQLIDRDYMFQSFIEGERWDHIEDELAPGENLALWQQLGRVVKLMHTTTKDRFGWPDPGPEFTTWSALVIDRFERIARSMHEEQLDSTRFLHILDVIRSHTPLLDEIRTPCLLHGDLWLFNILVTRGEAGAQIAGILDADRAWWGDPMADWLMFLLTIRRGEPEWDQVQAAFWDAYGWPEHGQAARFREEVYKAMHLGSIMLWYRRKRNPDQVARAGLEIEQIAQGLPELTR